MIDSDKECHAALVGLGHRLTADGDDSRARVALDAADEIWRQRLQVIGYGIVQAT